LSAPPSGKLVVGLTGGIGSGKSAAAEEFARLGATVVDTDAIAHELTGKAGAALAQIERLFGREFLASDGSMDRRRMREAVFSDPQARRKLEGLLHPMIRAESMRRIAAAAGPYVVYVVPLLVESANYSSSVGRVLVVDAPEKTRIERVRSRGLSEPTVRAIIRSQASPEARLAAADDVIENDGTLEDLHRRVGELHQKYLQFTGR
jgi:dephospho-CoA kinase